MTYAKSLQVSGKRIDSQFPERSMTYAKIM